MSGEYKCFFPYCSHMKKLAPHSFWEHHLPVHSQSPKDSGGPYPCTVGVGTYYAIASFALYLFVCLMLCVTPKPEPVCIRLQKEDKTDPCCVCCRKREDKLKEDEEAGDKENEDEEPKEIEEKKGFFAVFMCWRKDKEEEVEEEQDEEEPESTSEASNYHESVAEEDEIPTAVMVTATSASIAEEQIAEEDAKAEAGGGWNYFWPKQETQVVETLDDSDTKDLFFDAAVSENQVGDAKGNLTAEIY